MRSLVLALLCIALAIAATPRSTHAQSHGCVRAERGPWPQIASDDGGGDLPLMSRPAARAAVRALRRAWPRVPPPYLDREGVCIRTSFEHFVLRRVRVADAQTRLEWLRSHGFAASILRDSPLEAGASDQGWIYELEWTGAWRGRPPNGSLSAFLAADGVTLIAIAHWPEG